MLRGKVIEGKIMTLDSGILDLREDAAALGVETNSIKIIIFCLYKHCYFGSSRYETRDVDFGAERKRCLTLI